MHNPRQNSHLEHFLLVFVCHLSMLGSTGGVIIFIKNSHFDAPLQFHEIFLHCIYTAHWVFGYLKVEFRIVVAWWLDALDTELMCRLGLTNHITVVEFQAVDYTQLYQSKVVFCQQETRRNRIFVLHNLNIEPLT